MVNSPEGKRRRVGSEEYRTSIDLVASAISASSASGKKEDLTLREISGASSSDKKEDLTLREIRGASSSSSSSKKCREEKEFLNASKRLPKRKTPKSSSEKNNPEKLLKQLLAKRSNYYERIQG